MEEVLELSDWQYRCGKFHNSPIHSYSHFSDNDVIVSRYIKIVTNFAKLRCSAGSYAGIQLKRLRKT
jgi:hypothetical protein